MIPHHGGAIHEGAISPRRLPRRRQERRQPASLVVERAGEAGAAIPLDDVACVDVEEVSASGAVDPADHVLSPGQRHGVVPESAPLPRHIGLEPVWPAPQVLEARAVPHERIERGQEPDPPPPGPTGCGGRIVDHVADAIRFQGDHLARQPYGIAALGAPAGADERACQARHDGRQRRRPHRREQVGHDQRQPGQASGGIEPLLR